MDYLNGVQKYVVEYDPTKPVWPLTELVQRRVDIPEVSPEVQSPPDCIVSAMAKEGNNHPAVRFHGH